METARARCNGPAFILLGKRSHVPEQLSEELRAAQGVAGQHSSLPAKGLLEPAPATERVVKIARIRAGGGRRPGSHPGYTMD